MLRASCSSRVLDLRGVLEVVEQHASDLACPSSVIACSSRVILCVYVAIDKNRIAINYCYVKFIKTA
jgi:hypothetical protein